MTPIEAAPILVNSTLLASVTYDVGEAILQLEFCDGAIYRYFAVPAAIHNGLLAANHRLAPLRASPYEPRGRELDNFADRRSH